MRRRFTLKMRNSLPQKLGQNGILREGRLS